VRTSRLSRKEHPEAGGPSDDRALPDAGFRNTAASGGCGNLPENVAIAQQSKMIPGRGLALLHHAAFAPQRRA
jgi:hypothetical protein